MQPPYQPPPIPSAYGSPSGPPPLRRGDWSTAPKIVKGWAYPLTWLGIVVLPLVILAMLLVPGGLSSAPAGPSGAERGLMVLLYGVLLGVDIWLNRALKSGQPAAWAGQIVLSCLGLLGFPLGTLIHGYILSQWFRPEVKAWFGRH